ncbi:uncharacterized protein LOC129581210 [Paramacrobiotus metropolitanus]|uniref:uncharacterized protein LOC129581210 n=1 Tax=Paramacrobiotus metropolitanus TaxID=2943436 RepID=UPI002445F3FC|nr:uncharacterized protein LOC129581210 [Paramacrobiotus metropolitanus]XP_055328144.1 uncharacterized protein LOC129581210 [Paramacrobiotus metropolitanus]
MRRMPAAMLARSHSDGHLAGKSLIKHHYPPLTDNDPPAAHSAGIQPTTTCRLHNPHGAHYDGSYWSPAISEITPLTRPLGPTVIRTMYAGHVAVMTLINLSIVTTQTVFALFANRELAVQYANLTVFYSAAFLSSVFLYPLVCYWIKPDRVPIVTGATAVGYAVSLTFFPGVYVTIPVNAVCGGMLGVLSVWQGEKVIGLAVQYAHVKVNATSDAKSTAGEWYVWSQVWLQTGIMLAAITCSVARMWVIPSEFKRVIVHPLDMQHHCGSHVCQHDVAARLHHPMMMDEAGDYLNMILFLLAGCVAGLGSLAAGLMVCFARAQNNINHNRKQRGRSRAVVSHEQQPAEEELLSGGSASDSSECTSLQQHYSPPIISQLRGLVDLLCYNHKLQTLLPVCFLIGLHWAFMLTSFSQDFIECALTADYVGWSLAVYAGSWALSLYVTYQMSRQIKRVHILIWITFFQAGIEIVLSTWLPGNHDVPVFFVMSGVLGLTQGAYSALITGLWIRIFADDWTGSYSFMMAFKFAGCAFGLFLRAFVCVVVQVYILFAFLLVATGCFGLLEWKYSIYLSRTKQLGIFV